MSFQQRRTRAERFELALEKAFKSREEVIAVARIGCEHFVNIGMLNEMKARPDQALIVRHLPDFLVVTDDKTFLYIDAKMGPHLEKKAYTVYRALHDSDLPVVMFFYIGGKVYWQILTLIVFKDSHEVVAEFPEEKRFPVIDGWITPPKSVKSEMSGTPYKLVAVESLIEYDDDLLLEDLEEVEQCEPDWWAA